MKAKCISKFFSAIGAFFLILTVSSCATEGLEFSRSDDRESAIVSGYNGLSSKVVIPSKRDGFSITGIGSGAFKDCDFLQSVKIPNSVTSIGYEAFEGCSSLTSIKIPDSVTSIGSMAFYGCSSLTSIAIPDSVTSIGYGAFNSCTSLTSITIPDSVTSIESMAFYGCSSLTSITIPDSVTSICNYAFDECSSLTTVYYTGTKEQWNSITIDYANNELTSANITYNYVEEETE